MITFDYKYDYGCYTYSITKEKYLKFWWSDQWDIIEIDIRHKNGTLIDTIAKEKYKRSTLREVNLFFNYLVKYFRSKR